MRAHSLARVAARQNICIFCRIRRTYGPQPAAVQSRHDSRSLSTTSQQSGWGGLGQKVGGETLEKPLEFNRRPPTSPEQPHVQVKPEGATAGDRTRPTADLHDITHHNNNRPKIRDREGRRPERRPRFRQSNGFASRDGEYRPSFLSQTANADAAQSSEVEEGDIISRLGIGKSTSSGRDSKNPAAQHGQSAGTNGTSSLHKTPTAKGSIGGLQELLGYTDRNAGLLKGDSKSNSSASRSRRTRDFEDSSPRKKPNDTTTISWTPGSDVIFGQPQEASAASDLDREFEERSRRRAARFNIDGISLAQTPSTPARGKARGRLSGRDYDHLDDVDDFLEEEDRRRKKKKKAKKADTDVDDGDIDATPQIAIPDFITVTNLSRLLRVKLDDFIAHLEHMGFDSPNHDHVLDAETAGLIANEYNFTPIVSDSRVDDLVPRPPPEDKESLPPRPPIITIMGHVDHGKTTILDYLRKSSVAASEHGGITQHIGAFSVRLPGVDRTMTFLDTPGHAAFLEMRRRGANVTDIVVLVVAADDGVKPQTIEAIKHALAADVQIIVAINKVDKHEADPEAVKHELTRYGIEVEDMGGNIQAIAVSGKTGQGMQDLEEAILALSEAEDYRAEVDGPAEGWVIEANVTQAGRLATVLVRRGTLKPGDYIVAGSTWARIRSLRDDAGQLIQEAPPGTPVQIDGWRDQPLAGFEVLQAESEQQVKDVVEMRLEREEVARMAGDATAINATRRAEAEERAKVLAWESEQEWARRSYYRRPKDNEGWVEPEVDETIKKINLVIKADVTGSVEAVVTALTGLGNSEVTTNIIRSGVGPLNLSDIQHVSATGELGYIISFNQNIDSEMYRLAESAGVEIIDQNVIYRLVDAVKEKLSDQLPPIISQRVHGEAEISEVFEIDTKKQTVKIAGCRVTNGTISRERRIRVSRYNQIVFDGKLSSLKHVKKDVTEMRKGTECGMGFEEWQDFKIGDTIQCYEEIRERRHL